MKKLYWSGISNDERIKAISEITGIIDRYGLISHSARFSDISLSLVLEIGEQQVNDLYTHLQKVMLVEGTALAPTDSNRDCMVLLDITFTKSKGDLRIEVPNVPG